jgi:hypothetical protein
MGCCGQERSQPPGAMTAALRPAWPAPTGVQGSDRPASTVGEGVSRGMHGAAPDDGRRVVLRYCERARVLVRGPVTGRHYEFSAEQPTQSVEACDAKVLLLTRHFMRA